MVQFIDEKLFVDEFYYPDANIMNPLLYNVVTSLPELQMKPGGVTGRMTWRDLHRHHIPEIDKLLSWVTGIIRQSVGSVYQTLDLNPQIKELWGVYYEEGTGITRHHHLPYTHTFVYYVNAPEGSSPLVFTTSGHQLKPEAGKLVMFDSRLMHECPLNRARGRCIISGNFVT
mgnify:CR=1 FL=1